jgi:hypothetical protein
LQRFAASGLVSIFGSKLASGDTNRKEPVNLRARGS